MKTLRLTTLTLVVAVSLAGCTRSAQHVSRPDALSSVPSKTPHAVAPSVDVPLPTPTPSFEAITAPPLKQYVPPAVLVRGSIDHINSVTIGTTIRLTINVESTSRQAQTVPMWAGVSSGVIWDLLTEPPTGAEVGDSCEHHANGPFCTPSSIEWRQPLGPLEKKSIVIELRVVDFRCPARGDFHREMWMGVSGPVAKGPNAFRAWMLYENDRDDYVRAMGSLPKREWDCDVRTAT